MPLHIFVAADSRETSNPSRETSNPSRESSNPSREPSDSSNPLSVPFSPQLMSDNPFFTHHRMNSADWNRTTDLWSHENLLYRTANERGPEDDPFQVRESNVSSGVGTEIGGSNYDSSARSAVAVPLAVQNSSAAMRREMRALEARRRSAINNPDVTTLPAPVVSRSLIGSDELSYPVSSLRRREFEESTQRERGSLMGQSVRGRGQLVLGRGQPEMELTRETIRGGETNQSDSLNRDTDSDLNRIASAPGQRLRYSPMPNPTDEIRRIRDDPPEASPPPSPGHPSVSSHGDQPADNYSPNSPDNLFQMSPP